MMGDDSPELGQKKARWRGLLRAFRERVGYFLTNSASFFAGMICPLSAASLAERP
jgi:hypothetical protein